MFDNLNRLDLTTKDIELIEAALHTQKKILSVQSEAGGTGARQKLNELKNLSKRIGRARQPGQAAQASSWSQFFRSLTGPGDGYRTTR